MLVPDVGSSGPAADGDVVSSSAFEVAVSNKPVVESAPEDGGSGVGVGGSEATIGAMRSRTRPIGKPAPPPPPPPSACVNANYKYTRAKR